MKLGLNEFDPSIKFGRDGKLFVKKEAIEVYFYFNNAANHHLFYLFCIQV